MRRECGRGRDEGYERNEFREAMLESGVERQYTVPPSEAKDDIQVKGHFHLLHAD